ncbi:hypothetical protein RH831_10785 [Halodesulfurarchaeum sp. HSR-GB]|uniref:zinc finger domain-containing protein n=1 Tax=Halodesulfurarchaeum sp. HSR-GB TaxID=3074077 RepID=UPI002865DC9C|nr:hypothetical protein [Halodesulfurarchaeum sp. HSR-GB]MDR5657661.1 hypothetical protein [Halodesulfurarchaeum sp. HSR-GB]
MSQATLSGGSIDFGVDNPLAYYTTRINRWTFENKKIRRYVEDKLEGRVLNATAGKTHLKHDQDVIRNDIDPEKDADVHVDVRDLLDEFEPESFDTVVYDPPFTKSQADTTYNTDHPGYGQAVKSVFDDLLRPGGQLIQVGYTSNGMPLDWGYERTHIGLMNTFGRQYDILITVDLNSRTSTDLPVTLERTVAMNGSPKAGGQNEPFPVHYQFSRDETEQQDALRSFLEEYTHGWVVDLYADSPSIEAGPLFENDPNNPSSHTDFDPLETASELPYRFNTIIFDPGEQTFLEQTEYDGSTTGKDTAIKREINQVLTQRGRIIQVGRTSSVMPSSVMDDGFDYARIGVGIFSHPGAGHDLIATVDERRSEPDTNDSEPIPSGPTRFECFHCEEEWYVADYPAMQTDCPECGALPGSMCTEEVDGKLIPANPRTPREGLHQAREEFARSLEKLECPNHENGHVVMETSQYLPFQIG